MNVEEGTFHARDRAEGARLDAVCEFQIAGTGCDQRFDRIIRLVADFYNVPIAIVSFVEHHRQWLKTRIGVDFVETAESASFCTHVIEGTEPLVILDTHQDARFAGIPVVQDPRFIRFYAGAPLLTAAGLRLGALCIADTAPRESFSERERHSLAGFATLILDEMELQRSEHFRASMMGFAEATELAIITIGGTGFIESVNRSATELFGYSREEMIERSVDLIIPEPMRGAHHAGLGRIASGGTSRLSGQTMEVMAVRSDGSEFPIEMSLSVWTDALGIGIGAIIRDISERRLRDARLMRQANHDTLTGLPNRTRLEDLLSEKLARSSRQTVLLLDLDGFKEVNDKHGHSIGDSLLQAIAIRLPSALPAGTILARFGGDEFGVLLPSDVASPTSAASKAAQAILEAFVEPFTIAGHIFQLGISIGAAFAPEHGRYPQELIASADFALYRAKQSGGRTYRLFEPRMRDELVVQRALLDELLKGLHNGEFELFYQPQVCLENNRIVGLEALLRWRHPTRGLLFPGDFIGALEGSSLSIPVGLWVLNEACRQLALWKAAGFAKIRMGVNVFPAQFRSGTLAKDVFNAIAMHGIEPECLEIEVTESIVLEYNDIFLSDAKALHEAGIRIALDDFGTGFASLSALKKFPLTTLKIDRSFVIDLLTNPHDVAIARAMIAMGEDLGLETIAEGIETQAQEALLKSLGCRWGQGFLYGKALPVSEITTLLASGR